MRSPEPPFYEFRSRFLCVPEPLFLQARNRLRVLTELFLGASAARIRDRLKGCIKPFTHSWNHHFPVARTHVQLDEKNNPNITRTSGKSHQRY